jgi:hypothetical protein
MGVFAKRVLVTVVVLLAGGWSYGAMAFLAVDGSLTWSLPRRGIRPQEAHNLASYRFGPTLRASSFHRDYQAHHHPAFLVDGRAQPTSVEKWCSGIRDRTPWVEISWPEPRQLSEVTIRLAGSGDAPVRALRRYRLSCSSARGRTPTLAATSYENAITTHVFACPEARGLRIDWTLDQPDERACVYEIEAWGQAD